MGYWPRDRVLERKLATPTAGTSSINTSGSFANLSSYVAGFTDLTLANVEVGDVIAATFAGLWGQESSDGGLDVATIVSGSIANYFSTRTSSPPASLTNRMWYGRGSRYEPISGTYRYALQAGDISGGSVTLRPRIYTSNSKTFLYDPGQFSVVNEGPAS